MSITRTNKKVETIFQVQSVIEAHKKQLYQLPEKTATETNTYENFLYYTSCQVEKCKFDLRLDGVQWEVSSQSISKEYFVANNQ